MTRRALALLLIIATVSFGVPFLGGSGAAPAPRISVGRVHQSFQPNRGKIFVLVIGNDARSGNPNAARADALHLVGINTHTMRGGILNFPRDSYLSIPGYGTGRINEALYDGGPELVARTVESITGIRIDYWIMTGFDGFVKIIEELGPVRVRVPIPLNDPSGSGANLSAGMHAMRPLTALSFVRDRHDFPDGDVDRTTNQAKFLLALLRKLKGEVRSNPASLLRWIAVARQNTRFNVSPEEMFKLGVLATQMDASRIGNVTVPVTLGSAGAASVVFISSSAHSIYARFKKHASL